MDGEQITTRLIGVDTPETVHPQKPVEYYGQEASRFTRNLLLGESVFLEYGQERKDRCGRLLAYLYRVPDRLFVNQEIIRQGYGHAYTSFPFKYLETFRAYERKARDSKKGLWDQEKSFSDREIGETKKFQKDSTRKTTSETIVYVTKTGKKYHLPGCRYLSKGQSPISIASVRLKYSACLACKPPE